MDKWFVDGLTRAALAGPGNWCPRGLLVGSDSQDPRLGVGMAAGDVAAPSLASRPAVNHLGQGCTVPPPGRLRRRCRCSP